MSEYKHTPGPWKVDPNWGPSEEHPDWAAVIIGDSWKTIAGHVGTSNAYLIAAAPDLYEACSSLLEIEFIEGAATGPLKEALTKAAQATQKARGES